MSTYVPPVPPQPPTPAKRRRVWPWVLAAIVGTIVVSSIAKTANEYSQDYSPSVPIEDIVDDQTLNDSAMQLAWDNLPASAQMELCDFYNTPPVGTTPEMVNAFAEGADLSYAEADRLLDDLLPREC